MTILDRYVARLFLINVATLLLVLFGFVIAVDLSVNLSRFSRAAMQRYAESAGGDEPSGLHHALLTATLIVNLWGPRVLQLFGYLLGVVLVAGAGFTCAQLVRNREFVAVLASGTSLHRLARPFLVVTLGFSAVQAVNQELLVPSVAHLLVRDAGDSGQRGAGSFPVRLVPDDEGRLFHARRFSDADDAMVDVNVFERDERSRVSRIVSADRAAWDGRAWVLENGRARVTGAGAGGAPDGGDAPGGGPTGGGGERVERLESSLDPTRLMVHHFEGFGQNLSWGRIGRMIRDGGLDERARQRLERARWGRVGALLSTIVAVMAALPFFLRRAPGPMLVPALRAAPVGAAGLVAAAAAPVLELPGLPVWLGAMIPTLLLAPIAIALLSGVKT